MNQALVVLKGTKIAQARRRSPSSKPYKLGAQLGTTSYDYIIDRIKPSKQPAVYDTNDAAVQALKNKQIDGLVVDLPTAFYVTAAQVAERQDPRPVPDASGGEHFGMVFEKGNSLVDVRQQGAGAAEGGRHAAADPGAVAREGDRRSRPEVAGPTAARGSSAA